MTDPNQRVAHSAIIIGVDTPKDTHMAAAIDPQGRRLAERAVRTSPAGLLTLLTWSRQPGTERTWGVQGTGSYGAGLTRR